MKVAIFASGTGSNFEVLADDDALKKAGMEIMNLVCDQPGAPVIEKARQRNVPVTVIRLSDYDDRQHYEAAIVALLAPLQLDYILLGGYMRVITPVLLHTYPQRIINIHPSLLPAFSGLRSIERAYAAQVAETGVTIHYIDEGVDSGPMIVQAKVPLLPGDSLAALEQRVHDTEHAIYPQVVAELIKNQNRRSNSINEKSVGQCFR
ncbi:phosphoribosylglycinamide formyltransferase [Latilactobacillus curvatus]|uniref:phosphoribosylglycinamide formyltransferase n=1 Tax=Latilactobacillus curvatus TaxID=28038 RepID=UPI000313EDD7|nr:phosphoribosylglycinamide formyltransferase [Latilactobacillus curvatus]